MPSAETRRERLCGATLYLCTDARRERGGLSGLAEFAEAAISGGVDVIQLRDKGSAGERAFGPLEALQELEALQLLSEVCRRSRALLAVNDRADLAFASGADILHLGQDDLPVTIARRIVGPDLLIGRSTHDGDQAAAAATESGVDYFCTGPCWPTPTKPGRTAPGLALVRSTAELNQRRPWFAIGGIDAGRLDEVIAAGATRVVVVRAITEAEDPHAAAQKLKRRLLAG